MPVTAVVCTIKGAFVLRGGDARDDWRIDGPLFKGWKATSALRGPDGRWILATASDVYGPAVHVSDDLENWRQIENGPAWPPGGERKLTQIWTFAAGHGRIWAGVDEAGLFVSDDRGESWQPVEGLNEHETRGGWFPGAGGLCAHSLLLDPNDRERIWCGISAVGVFRSDDGGATWHPKNDGVPIVIEDKQHKNIGCCVHGLSQDPNDANTIWRREHVGMFRSRDGGDHWERIENGLPSRFGFPVALDRSTGDLYVIPLESDEYRMPIDGKLTVYKSSDGGESWQSKSAGLPSRHAYMGVLRGALDVDHETPCGVYFGTTAGTLHVSNDAGESWRQLDCTLPRVLWVSVHAGD